MITRIIDNRSSRMYMTKYSITMTLNLALLLLASHHLRNSNVEMSCMTLLTNIQLITCVQQDKILGTN